MRFYLCAVFIFYCVLHILIGQNQVSAGLFDQMTSQVTSQATSRLTSTVQGNFKQAEAPKGMEEKFLETLIPLTSIKFIKSPLELRRK